MKQIKLLLLFAAIAPLSACFDFKGVLVIGPRPDGSTGSVVPKVYQKLNDTGVTTCGDYSTIQSGAYPISSASGTHNNNVDCAMAFATADLDGFDNQSDIVRAGQDAHFGRDATDNDDSDGAAGFSWIKLDATGAALVNQSVSYSATPWPCLQDDVTGLVWEVKTNAGLHNKTNTYSWYMPTAVNAGTQNAGVCSASNCDTQAFIDAVNTQQLCGVNNWRLPTTEELSTIVHMGTYNPAVDTNFFPHTVNAGYWSSSEFATDNDNAWLLEFGSGTDIYSLKNSAANVRLVADGL